MKGDIINIEEKHYRAGRGLVELLLPEIQEMSGRFILTVAGESGSGKSEVAEAFRELLAEKDLEGLILQQDDYFVYPPRTNAEMRRKDISHVGASEVKLDVLDENLADIQAGKNQFVKPLVIFAEDRITEEIITLSRIRVVIVEGTYTTQLKNAHCHAFIYRTYQDTWAARQRRARETQDEFLEQVLRIENEIISAQRSKADIIITKDYGVKRNA